MLPYALGWHKLCSFFLATVHTIFRVRRRYAFTMLREKEGWLPFVPVVQTDMTWELCTTVPHVFRIPEPTGGWETFDAEMHMSCWKHLNTLLRSRGLYHIPEAFRYRLYRDARGLCVVFYFRPDLLPFS